jgi:hypothetical protein
MARMEKMANLEKMVSLARMDSQARMVLMEKTESLLPLKHHWLV